MAGLYGVEGGTLTLNLHEGQRRAWDSPARWVAVIAGRQSGKTSFAPLWLWREIQLKGPGDYAFICPTFQLMEKKALPEFKTFFHDVLQLGRYTTSPVQKFTFSAEGARRTFGTATDVPTHVYFGHAQNPDSLESATYKGAVLDEAGQKTFKLDSYHAIRGRLALNQGRALITTTPYSNLGWLKSEIYDPWSRGDRSIEVIQFASTMNPMFKAEEFEDLRRSMPAWKFSLYYLGKFEKPAGLIYDCFDEARHKVRPFRLPDSWHRHGGLDFGGVNTAAVFCAEDPQGKLYFYREYHEGGRTARGHADELRRGETSVVFTGGSKSEGQWREEFRAAGLPVLEPAVHEVEVGIDRVYGAIQRGEVYVFDTCEMLLNELATYAREVDAAGNVTEKIENKADHHVADALRYVVSRLKGGSPHIPPARPAAPAHPAPAGVFGTPGRGALPGKW